MHSSEKAVIRKGLKIPEATETLYSETTLGKILGSELPDVLGLLSSPVLVRRFESPYFMTSSVQYLDREFYGENFIELLTASRPGNGNGNLDIQDREAIIDDWGIIDRDDAEAKKLVSDHAKDLEPYWSEFIDYHARSFLTAVFTLSPEESVEILEKDMAKLRSRTYAVSHFEDILEKYKSPDGTEKYSPNVKRALSSNWVTIYPVVEQDPDFSQIFPFKEALLTASGVVVDRLIDAIPDDIRVLLVDNKDFRVATNYRIINTEQYQTPYYGGYSSRPRYGISFAHIGNQSIRMSIDDASSYMDVSLKDGLPEDLTRTIEDPTSKSLSPWMVWTRVRKTGARFYHSSHLPTWLESIANPQDNSLIGFLAALALSSKQRKKLPEILHLSERAVPQYTKEAQMPVVASVSRGFILRDSPIFQAIESIAA